jgi:amino acid adenylation domain-containing protein
MRAGLLQPNEEEHILLLTMHHIVADGWSLGVFLRELSAHYEAGVTNQIAPLPKLPVQYSDFAQWERERVQGELLDTQLDYWKNKLSALPPALPLASDFQRPAIQTFKGARCDFALSRQLTELLKSLSRQEDCTLFMTLLAAFQTLLLRYTAQDDIPVGTSITNHARVETEPLVGLFSNTLVLRTDLSGNPSFRELLRRVREVTLEAYAHQDLPFEKLVEELQPQRELSHSPLFQVMFVLQHGPAANLKLPGLSVSLIDRHNGTAKFDLLLSMVEEGGELTGSLEYSTDLFEAGTIERLCTHFQVLLETIVTEPERNLSEFRILTPAEQHRLLVEWNDTAIDCWATPLVYEQFELQAASVPEDVAITFGAEQLTYGELNARANQLAHALRRLGVGPDVLVGLLTERSLEMFVGLLGILKAGGAYLPLDPRYPRARLAFMLEDSEVPVLLTQQHLAEDLPAHQAEVLCLDSEWQRRVAPESTENPPAINLGEHLAFTIYTSGSTGRPKGVQLSQRALVNLLLGMQQQLELTKHDVWLAVTSLSFDIATLEVCLPLLLGARVVLVTRETAADGTALSECLRQSGATMMQATPASWRMLLAADWTGHGRLKILSGGEALKSELAEALLENCRGGGVWNGYGPTETTIYSVVTAIAGSDRITIGRPLPNTQVYILDAYRQPVPAGVAGELYIGGEGLARGYLKRPALTAERFIPNPFSAKAGARMYRTGDLVRYLPDGAIEYLGRNDYQVKVRGYRIEPGEIESVLTQHPAVLQSVVMPREAAAGDVRLAAYVIANETQPWPGEAELRSFLSERLPGFMVPSTFMLLETFPLTPNAKVDRKSLPEPDWGQSGAAVTYVAPRTPFEEVISGIWSQLFGIERVGINDNFFELGGHSLLATTFVSRVRDVFQVELPLRRLFETPTPAGIAEAVQSLKQDNIEAVPLAAGARGEELSLSFSQERLWCLEQLTPGTTAYNLVGALSLRGVLDVSALNRSLNEIIKRHEVLRTTFVTIDGRPTQAIASSLTLTLPVLTPVREDEVDQLIAEESRFSFDLTSGSLLRAALLQVDEQSHVLILNMHHIISDGWSIGILLRELTAFYKSFVQAEPASLPDLPVQYADFALWQRRRAAGDDLNSQLSYWKRQLEGALPVLELPADKQRPRVQTHEGERQSFVLSEELTNTLKTFSQCEGVTVFMTLLAVFKTFLHRLTGEDDIVVGSPIAGRNRAETENLIGFFVNTLVLRTDLSGSPTFRALLRRVRETALGAYSNQDVAFEHLLEALQPERDVSRTPLFQVFFNMLNFEENAIELPGLTTTVLPSTEVTAKFDLTLYVEEENQRLKFDFVYNPSLFSNERVAEMIEQLRQLLSAVVAHPEESVDRFSLITPGAIEFLPDPAGELQATWSGAVHTQFTERARCTPRQVAVIDRSETYTYQELEARSNQLAQYLLAHDVKPQDVVAIYAQRSASLVLALLGVLKAGAAFVILDPHYPTARLLGYLTAIKPKGWIQLPEAGIPDATLQAYAKTCSFSLDLEVNGLDHYSTAETGIIVGPEDMAYVAFTSGSSGTPKPIAGKHGSLAHFALWANQTFDIGEADRFSMLSGLSHDPFHRDAFMALQLGGTICIPDPEHLTIPAKLAAWMEEQQITVANLTPAMGQVIGQAGSEKFNFSSLRYLFFVGDVLTRRDTARLRTLAPATEIVNLYGTTETSRALSYYVVPQSDGECSNRKEILPLGRGISEVQLLVMNGAGQQAGVGEPGEICFRSPHLAKGYWEDEQLTRERFVSNPFTGEENDLLYKTGDLGRYRPDGNVEPLGRADCQVQIRGFRVEPGEIEAVLGRHAAVRESAVIMREDVPGQTRLVAYVVPAGHDAPSAGELRSTLQNELPDYMVPASFVMLDQLPLTPNGKLDRRALPAPVQTRNETGNELPESRSAVEEILAETWAVALGVEHVSLHDNFFELGGHSLTAIQVMARVADLLHVQLPVRALFESPTVSALAKAVENARKTDQISLARPLVPQSRASALPLSFAQQRLWFLDQFQPGLGVYNIPATVRLRGLLNPDALEHSLNAIVSRHEAIRTTFTFADGQPEQLIAPSSTIKIALKNLETLPEDVQSSEIERLTLLEGRQPFDLTRGPLLRASLLRLREDEHVLVVTIHHIVSDAWSLGVIVRELRAFYDAFVEGTEPALSELPIQYADFALWQREWLQGDRLEAQLEYWRKKLEGQLPVLELPTDRPRPPVQSFQGAREAFTLARELSEQLNVLCRQEGVTLFMLLLAAFQTLLYRYSGQTDILTGTPIAGRERTETQNLIGLFVNTLVMRNTFSGALRFRELLALTRETALDAYAHQDVPFEKVVEELRLDRDTSREALFQVMFVLQNTPAPVLELKGLSLEVLPIHNQTAKFDLLLAMQELNGLLQGSLEYSTDLFDKTTIERMVGQFETLLQSIATDVEQELDELSLLTADEEHHLLYDLNATTVAYPLDNFIHQQFEAQAERTPDAVALVFEGQQLSYGELNKRVNRLAHFLRDLGVGPEVLVGVMMERSLEMVVSLMGIIKAGGAYVPLEPSYPEDRLAYITTNAQMRVVLTQERFRELLNVNTVPVIPVDAEWPNIELCPAANPVSGVTGENLAYVIYTSGSTGRPKGAMNTHYGICNRLLWMQDAYQLNESDRVVQKTPFSFDVSVWEFFWPLMTGATLVVATPGGHQDSSYLVKLIREQEITTIHFVPSMLQAFLEDPNLETCTSLKRVICSGEALQYAQQERLLARLDTSLHNLYGPTEAAIDVTFWECRRDSGRTTVPIGYPIANTQIHLLNGRLEPVPTGMAGELHIGGINLARGYLNRADLTAEKFIPNPFSADAGARLYKTGDSARYLADGSIEYLDRLDQQVKIRGFRIELGEIEAVLRQDQRLRDVVVAAREDHLGEKCLMAYLVAEQSSLPALEELRSHLKETLPAYMVPAHFVYLDELPLTTSGKVDRKALPAPPQVDPTLTESYATPVNQLEEILADIWAGVLGLERVGRDDNFFDLGGHSLLATKLVYRIQESLGVALPLRRIFEEPTVAAAAGVIEQFMRTGSAPVLPPIPRAERNRELPLSFAQQRLWIMDQLTPDTYNEHAAIRLTGPLKVGALEQSLNEIVRRHEILRTTFVAVAGRPTQNIAASLTVTLLLIDLRHLSRSEVDAEVSRRSVAECRRSFDLAQGPLLRAALLRTGENEHVVLLSLPHIVFDGWSNAILIHEVATLYEAFSNGLTSPLPELPVQYADFAVWQREWLQADILETHLTYWKEQLDGAPQILQLPVDRSEPQTSGIKGMSLPLNLPAALADDLKVLSRQHDVTLFMTLLTAFQILLYSYSGQTDIVVGTNVANRTRSETEKLIGFFVNLLVLRTDLSSAPSLRELLSRVRDVTLTALAHQDLPFEKIVAELRLDRDHDHTPLVQAVIQLQTETRLALELPGLEEEFLDIGVRSVPFDLVLTMSETNDGLTGAWLYNAGLFDAATIARMASRFELLLNQLVTEPDVNLDEFVELLKETERQQRQARYKEFKNTRRLKLKNVELQPLFAK